MSNTALLRQVRQIVAEHPERHRQEDWISNAYSRHLTGGQVEDMRNWALRPIPPAYTDDPLCGTVGCVAGWAAILYAPAGTRIGGSGSLLVLPTGRPAGLRTYAQKALAISDGQADYLFAAALSHDEVLTELDYLIEHPDDDRSATARRRAELAASSG